MTITSEMIADATAEFLKTKSITKLAEKKRVARVSSKKVDLSSKSLSSDTFRNLVKKIEK